MKVIIKDFCNTDYRFILFFIVLFLASSPVVSSAQSLYGNCTTNTICNAMESSCLRAGGIPEKKPIQPSGWNISCHAKPSTTAPVSGPCRQTGFGDLPTCTSMAQNCRTAGGEPDLKYGGSQTLAVCLLKVVSSDPPTPTDPTEASSFVPLVGIPGVDPDADFGGYINALYVLSISLAALLAVIKIIVAGVKWMLTDVVTSKADAKKDIQGALTGLLIIISAVVILTVINPNLVEFNILPETTTTTP